MGSPGIFDISDRFEKNYPNEVFLLLRIEVETERPILDAELACWRAENVSRLFIKGGGEIGVGVMSFEKWLKTKVRIQPRMRTRRATMRAKRRAMPAKRRAS